MKKKREPAIDSTTNESDYSLFTIRQAAHACTALSLLVYGSYGNINEAYLYLGEQVRERGLTPAR